MSVFYIPTRLSSGAPPRGVQEGVRAAHTEDPVVCVQHSIGAKFKPLGKRLATAHTKALQASRVQRNEASGRKSQNAASPAVSVKKRSSYGYVGECN